MDYRGWSGLVALTSDRVVAAIVLTGLVGRGLAENVRRLHAIAVVVGVILILLLVLWLGLVLRCTVIAEKHARMLVSRLVVGHRLLGVVVAAENVARLAARRVDHLRGRLFGVVTGEKVG